MPKYIVGCADGHNFETPVSFAEFDEFKQDLVSSICGRCVGVKTWCQNLQYIKLQAVPFSIQPGLYDDFSTGSAQEKQLRREGYL